jgi:hypothetical protein
MPSVFPTSTHRTQQCFVSNSVKVPSLAYYFVWKRCSLSGFYVCMYVCMFVIMLLYLGNWFLVY